MKVGWKRSAKNKEGLVFRENSEVVRKERHATEKVEREKGGGYQIL